MTGSVEHEIVRHNARRVELKLKGSSIPRDLERSLDATEYDGPVKLVSSFRSAEEPGTVRVVREMDEVTLISVEGMVLRTPMAELLTLQAELIKMQSWVEATGAKVLIIFEEQWEIYEKMQFEKGRALLQSMGKKAWQENTKTGDMDHYHIFRCDP